jgi:Fic family protein
MLKVGTSDSRKDWFVVGGYKKLPNEVGGKITTMSEDVAKEIKSLLEKYNSIQNKTLEDVINFHPKFECTHPFQDGNGRIGRLIMFRECLANNIVPFIITDDLKVFYYRGLQHWDTEKGFHADTILTIQDHYKKCLDYFKINY